MPPYKPDGSTAFPAKGRAGCYLIYDTKKRLQYIGHSGTDVYKTMYRHFQRWNDSSQFRATYSKNSFVRVVYTRTEKQAQELETALIIKYKPNDNTNKLNRTRTQPEAIMLESFEETPVASVSIYESGEALPF